MTRTTKATSPSCTAGLRKKAESLLRGVVFLFFLLGMFPHEFVYFLYLIGCRTTAQCYKLPEIEFLVMDVCGGDFRFEEFLFKGLHHRERTAHVNVMSFDITACILDDLIHGQRTVYG